MEKLTRRRYTLEYKQEAVRLVTSGQRVAGAARCWASWNRRWRTG
jgi:transposase-like protein